MSKRKFKVCSRLEIEGKEKPVWPNTGMTVTINDDTGRMTMFDGRTKMNYFLFELEDRDNQQAPQQPAQQNNSEFDDFDQDVPF